MRWKEELGGVEQRQGALVAAGTARDEKRENGGARCGAGCRLIRPHAETSNECGNRNRNNCGARIALDEHMRRGTHQKSKARGSGETWVEQFGW
jgi:hypothetical protein